MHNSTGAYVKRRIQKLMTECDISLEDIQSVVNKMKADDTPIKELTSEDHIMEWVECIRKRNMLCTPSNIWDETYDRK